MTSRRIAALVVIALAGITAAALLLVVGSPDHRPFHVAVIGLCGGSIAHMLRARQLSWIGCCFVAGCAAVALAAL